MSSASENAPLLNATIRVDNLPATGRDLKVVATPDQLAALSALLDIVAVEKLEATLLATPLRGGVRITGQLVADVVQACVVSFDPVTQHVDEPIDRVFLPGKEKPFAGAAGAEVFVDLEGDDLPDHFDGHEADLSELLVETLSLGLDPYPRAPGAALHTDEGPVDDGPLSPFSSLKVLKDPGANS